jgi:hypothetical protein
LGESYLRAGAQTQFHIKHCYAFPNDELHTSCPVGEPTATLFLEDRWRVKPFADVFSLRYPSNDSVPYPPLIKATEYLHALRYLRKRRPLAVNRRISTLNK